ncbi:MAG: hypothetical protein KKD86_09970 [Bacteroidetes bacterium]|nr:hypothetical protein [Bacteroidota bacterium]MBU1679164.1 hypothetical protein [Bacteroidota bacterium]
MKLRDKKGNGRQKAVGGRQWAVCSPQSTVGRKWKTESSRKKADFSIGKNGIEE